MYLSQRRLKSEFILQFGKLMQKNLPIWSQEQKKHRKKLYTKDLVIYAAAFLVGLTPGKHEHDYLSNLGLHIVFAIISAIIAVVINIGIENKIYQDEVKKTIFPELLKIFGPICYSGTLGAVDQLFEDLVQHKITDEEFDKKFEDFIDTNHLSNYLIPTDVFNKTGLFSKEINDRDDDDCFSGSYNDVDFIVNECELNYRNPKNHKDYVPLFDGLALQFKMQKKVNAHVIILSKSLIKPKLDGYEKVTLEYEKFNKKYDLYVKGHGNHIGQVEARYLFNTAFLDRFMQIHTSFKVNKMWCSILEDNLLILLHTNKDLFEMNHLLGRIDDINQYQTLFNEFTSMLSFIDVLNLSSRTKL